MTRRNRGRAIGYRARRVKNPSIAKLARALPPSVEGLPLVQRTVKVLDQGALFGGAKLEALESAFGRLEKDVRGRVGALESRTERRTKRVLRRLRSSPLARRISAVPKALALRIDQLLEDLGLMRKARHRELLARAKRRVIKPKRDKPAAVATA